MEIPEILEIKEQLETKSLKSIITELLQNEETKYNITNKLLKDLMNIKHALKSSSYEIQQIFQYPLKLMSRNYSIGKIQMEVFHDIILKDNELPSTRILGDEEYIKELDKKLLEEVNEYLENDNIEEPEKEASDDAFESKLDKELDDLKDD